MPSSRRSENGDRVEERPRATWQPERTGHDHELPALLLLAHLDQLLELKTIRTDHAHGHDLEEMDRIRDPLDMGGDRLTVSVGQEDRHLAFMEHEQCRDVKAGFAVAVVTVVPGPQLQPPPVMAGAEEQDIPFPQRDAL